MDHSPSRSNHETIICRSTDQAHIETCSLVLSATGVSHRIIRDKKGSTTILAPASQAERAAYQLDCFFQENMRPPPVPSPDYQKATTTAPTIALISALALFHAITGPWHPNSPWFHNGAGDADAIMRHGEWYRLVTALTLHADFSHLAGNCLIGGFLLHFFLQIHGAGIGLFALLFSATLGNWVNVVIHGGTHHFVGFSTAVFAVIGMLCSQRIIEERKPFGLGMLVPFMAGVALLAMLGSSGVRTDLGAHLFGLMAGITTGLLLEIPPMRALRRISWVQTCLTSVALFALLICWHRALAAPRF